MSNPSTSIPKLWFDMHSQKAPATEGQCDCDCACSTSVPPGEGRALSKFLACQLSVGGMRDVFFGQETLLTRVGQHWAALNAEGEKMVVFDDQIRQLFSYLPCTQGELRSRFSEWPAGVLERVLGLFFAASILSSPQAESKDTPIQSKSDTLVAWLHLTNQCNLSCTYCYVNRTNEQMDASTTHRTVDAVFRSALAHGYAHVKLKYAGGEPTLHFQALQAAQQRAEALSMQMDIDLDAVLLTNGVHITDAQIDTLLAHGIRVTVSLDGVGRHHDVQRPLAEHNRSSFDLIARNLDRLLGRGISPHISVTITKQSLRGLSELIEYLLDQELRFSFNFYREPDRSPGRDALAFTSDEMISGLRTAFQAIEKRLPAHSLLSNLADWANLRIPHARTCGVGQNYMVIDCDGNVAQCQMELENPVTTVDAADPLAMLQSYSGGIQNLTVEQKECQGCVWRYRCAGGCPRLTFQRTGRYDARSPLCEVYRAILPEVVRLEALRLVRYEEPWDFSIPN